MRGNPRFRATCVSLCTLRRSEALESQASRWRLESHPDTLTVRPQAALPGGQAPDVDERCATGGTDGLRRRVADESSRPAGGRPREESRGERLHPRVGVRLARAVAGAVRHPRPDPGRDRADRRRPDGHQPGLARLDRARLDLRDPERHLRPAHHLRHRAGRLGASRDRTQAPHPRGDGRGHAGGQGTGGGRDGRLPRDRDPVPVGGAGLGPPDVGRGIRSPRPRHHRAPRRRLRAPARRSPDPGVDPRRGHGGRQPAGTRAGFGRYLRGGAGLRRRRHRAPARAASLVRRHGRQPRGRAGQALRRELLERAEGALRLHQGPRRLRLLPPRPGRQSFDRLRSRRHRGPLLRAGAGRGPHPEAHHAAGHGHRPLRHLPHARCGGRDP